MSSLSFLEKVSREVWELTLAGSFFQKPGPAKRTKLLRDLSLEIEVNN